MAQKSRNYCFTWNNYPSDLIYPTISQDSAENIFGKFKYIIFGFENCPTTGTPHIQGYVDWINPRTIGGLKKINKSIHWEIRKGTFDQAVDYCKKTGLFVEFGEPNQQGARTDLTKIKTDIINGLKVDDIAIDNPELYHKYGRTFNKIEDIAMRRRFRTTMTRGIWYWGPTGVGKSHLAFEGYTPETHYVHPNDNGWWDGYAQQDTVIINDFRGEISYNDLLKLVDKWPEKVKRRGREPLPFLSKTVIVTSSLHPAAVYKRRNEEDSLEQLFRRFEIVRVAGTQVLEGNTSASSICETSYFSSSV